jgi:hypothetical protein
MRIFALSRPSFRKSLVVKWLHLIIFLHPDAKKPPPVVEAGRESGIWIRFLSGFLLRE